MKDTLETTAIWSFLVLWVFFYGIVAGTCKLFHIPFDALE
jgi:TRAP-type C4-dicarboxylate transport system permease small subunit